MKNSKAFLSLFILFITANHTFLQVGFNNPTPHPSSIIDLTAHDKGLLVPRTELSYKTLHSVSQSNSL